MLQPLTQEAAGVGSAPLQVAAGSNKTFVLRAVVHSHKLQAHSVEAQQLDAVHNSGKVVCRCPFAEPVNVERGSVGITCIANAAPAHLSLCRALQDQVEATNIAACSWQLTDGVLAQVRDVVVLPGPQTVHIHCAITIPSAGQRGVCAFGQVGARWGATSTLCMTFIACLVLSGVLHACQDSRSPMPVDTAQLRRLACVFLNQAPFSYGQGRPDLHAACTAGLSPRQGWTGHAAPWTAAQNKPKGLPPRPRPRCQRLAAKPCTCLACSSCRTRARAGPELGCFVLEPAGCLRHGRWVGQDLLWRIDGLFNLGCCLVCSLECLGKVKRDRCAHLCQAASICRVQHGCMVTHICQHLDNRNVASTACMAVS